MTKRRRSAHPAFGARMKEVRVALGWSQDELADRLGVSHGYPGELERGSFEPSRKLVHRIAQVLGLDEAELVGLLGWGRPTPDAELTIIAETREQARPLRQLIHLPAYVLEELAIFALRLKLGELDGPEQIADDKTGAEK